MTEIVYTRDVDVKASSLVDEAYYNENTGDLYLDLNDYIYKYTNVPAHVVDEFEKADSAGNFYSTVIKRTYGPGESLGSWLGVDYVEVEKTPQFNAGVVTATEIRKGEGLVANTANFSLKPFDEPVKVEGVEREYVVTFEVAGIVDHKRHTLKASSVDEAVSAVLDLGKMLDLNFVVREVTIRFE